MRRWTERSWRYDPDQRVPVGLRLPLRWEKQAPPAGTGAGAAGSGSSLGADVTAQYRRGAEETLRLAELYGCTTAVLKERSPSCGSGAIYDGTFTGTVTEGWGTAAALLRRHGVRVLGESQLASLLEELGSTQ